MSLNFGGINIGGTSGGGNMSTYLPNNTVFKVETDGSGDFTSIKDAVDNLIGKWSNGKVIISIGSGTYDIDSTINISGQDFNISELTIVGNSNSNTILNYTGSGNNAIFHISKILSFTLNNIKLQKVTKEGYGLQLDAGTNYTAVKNVIFENCATGLMSVLCDTIHIQTGNTFKNCIIGINSTRSSKVNTDVGATIAFDNCGTAWSVQAGGMIATSLPVSNITYTSVTTKCSQTVGTFNANGYIGGTLQN